MNITNIRDVLSGFNAPEQIVGFIQDNLTNRTLHVTEKGRLNGWIVTKEGLDGEIGDEEITSRLQETCRNVEDFINYNETILGLFDAQTNDPTKEIKPLPEGLFVQESGDTPLHMCTDLLINILNYQGRDTLIPTSLAVNSTFNVATRLDQLHDAIHRFSLRKILENPLFDEFSEDDLFELERLDNHIQNLSEMGRNISSIENFLLGQEYDPEKLNVILNYVDLYGAGDFTGDIEDVRENLPDIELSVINILKTFSENLLDKLSIRNESLSTTIEIAKLYKELENKDTLLSTQDVDRIIGEIIERKLDTNKAINYKELHRLSENITNSDARKNIKVNIINSITTFKENQLQNISAFINIAIEIINKTECGNDKFHGLTCVIDNLAKFYKKLSVENKREYSEIIFANLHRISEKLSFEEIISLNYTGRTLHRALYRGETRNIPLLHWFIKNLILPMLENGNIQISDQKLIEIRNTIIFSIQKSIIQGTVTNSCKATFLNFLIQEKLIDSALGIDFFRWLLESIAVEDHVKNGLIWFTTPQNFYTTSEEIHQETPFSLSQWQKLGDLL